MNFEDMSPADQFMIGENKSKAELAAKIKQLAADMADAHVRLESASSAMWIQVRSHAVEKIEAELHAAIDRLAAI